MFVYYYVFEFRIQLTEHTSEFSCIRSCMLFQLERPQPFWISYAAPGALHTHAAGTTGAASNQCFVLLSLVALGGLLVTGYLGLHRLHRLPAMIKSVDADGNSMFQRWSYSCHQHLSTWIHADVVLVEIEILILSTLVGQRRDWALECWMCSSGYWWWIKRSDVNGYGWYLWLMLVNDGW